MDHMGAPRLDESAKPGDPGETLWSTPVEAIHRDTLILQAWSELVLPGEEVRHSILEGSTIPVLACFGDQGLGATETKTLH
jgi:hypothetical protein